MSTIASPAALRRLAAGVVAISTLVACTGGDDDTAPTTTETPTTTTVFEPENDGMLLIGAFLPLTGPGAAFGERMIDALELGITTINDAGGVLGKPVRLRSVDEGAGQIEDLLADGVDAIIGPASSTLTMSVLHSVVDPITGVVTCSPMATSAALDDFPDEDFFFRTAPSDSLQMVTIAEQAERTGAQSIAVGYLDDPYGRGLEAAFRDAIGSSISVVTVPFSGDEDDLSPVADDLLADDPPVVVVLGDADDGGRLLATLDEETHGNDDLPEVLINDSLRQARSVIQNLTPEFRERLTGHAPQSGATTDAGPEGFFVAHAVDCLNLVALAVIEAGSDDPRVFRRQVSSVSSGGRACQTFEACATAIRAGRGIDYDGFSGPVNLSPVRGDPIRARFDIFQFDEDGNEVPVRTIETEI